jgi:hypothetical protein
LIVEFLEDVEPSGSVYPQKVLRRGNTRVDWSSFIWRMFDCTYGKSNWLPWATISFRIVNSWRIGSVWIYLDFAKCRGSRIKKYYRIRRSTISSDYVVYLKSMILMLDLKMIQNCFHKPWVEIIPHCDIVAHFDLELHQMDVWTTFLNGDLK